ncbi:MAG: adenine deaminase [Bacteroidales bacterium]|nr:adenine deaminase [Bacteroidales bacterium]
MKIQGRLIDIFNRQIFDAEIEIENGMIADIKEISASERRDYIMPGLIDAHVHIESSMITPGSFAMAAVSRGTTGVVSDPHEIANVMGLQGIDFMIEDGRKTPFRFWFGAPSCVPATTLETSGARLDASDTEKLLKRDDIKFLAEMMNFPGVINDDEEVLKKIAAARKLGKPVDGHAPGLTGPGLRKYINAGITTDHECSSIEEALEKISLGMKVIIREGSAGRNLQALKSLYADYPEMIMLSSDDIHPEMLRERHLDKLLARLIDDGYDMFDVIRSVTLNPVLHYNLNAGLLRPGDPADFIIVDDPRKMNILETWIGGQKVYENGNVLFKYEPGEPVNKFNCRPVGSTEIEVPWKPGEIRVITAFDGELFTKETLFEPARGTFIETDISADILKIIVKDRYNDAPPAVGFIKGFGLKQGAFASSVAHDSHNIIAIGTNNEDILTAVNEVVKLKGGLAVCSSGKVDSLQLNIAGIMSDRSCSEVAGDYVRLSALVKSRGCTMSAPFMTLSFMALLVIPELKLSDRGLFDGNKFQYMPLFV